MKVSSNNFEPSIITVQLGSDLISTITISFIYKDLLILIIFDDLYILYINEKNENEINNTTILPKSLNSWLNYGKY